MPVSAYFYTYYVSPGSLQGSFAKGYHRWPTPVRVCHDAAAVGLRRLPPPQGKGGAR
jgi:hypothetical protein